MESVQLDVIGHRRSPATMPGYHRGRPHVCQSFPVGITVAGSTISKTVRPCARGR